MKPLTICRGLVSTTNNECHLYNFCFKGEYSSCADKQLSDFNSNFTNEPDWNKTLYFSEEACKKGRNTFDQGELFS
jgi:hypothetical protein